MAADSTPRSTTITARDLVFTADVAGPVDGPVVLLLHGFPQTRHTWRAELPTLAAAGFRAIAPDQRGYSPGARPPGIEAYQVEHLVADILALADRVGAERFHLVGHDWGGQVAWLIAAHHPERVRSLAVLSRPHPAAFARAMATDDEQAGRSSHHRSFLRPEATDEQLVDGAARLRRGLEKMGVPTLDVEVYLSTLGRRPAMDAAINWYRAAGASGLRAADTPSVTVPTLYVWGDEDSSVGRAAAMGTADFVDGRYRFVELAGIGHFVTDQDPTALPPLLLDHLAPGG